MQKEVSICSRPIGLLQTSIRTRAVNAGNIVLLKNKILATYFPVFYIQSLIHTRVGEC